MAITRGVCLFQNKGHRIPDEFLAKALAKYNSGWGAALKIMDANKQPKLFMDVIDNAEATTLDHISKTLQRAFDIGAGMEVYIAGYPSGYLKEDLQPFPVLYDKDNDPVLGAFLVGDFSNFTKTDSSHIPEYHVAEELTDKFTQIYNLCEGDMNKFMDQLKSPSIEKDLMRMGAGDTFISLFSSIGRIKNVKSNKDMWIPQDWGATTDLCEPKSAKQPEPEKKTEPAVNPNASKPVFELSGKAAEPEKTEKPEIKVTSEHVGPKPDEKPNEGKIKVGPPPSKNADGSDFTNKQKQKWWHDLLGFQPKAYKHAVVYVDKNAIKDFKLLGLAMGIETKTADKSNKPAATATTPKPTKKEGQVAQQIPVLGKDDKEKFGTQFIKAVDNNSNFIGDPATMQDEETKCPPFSSAVGIDLESTFRWRYATLVKLGYEVSPEALALLCMEYRSKYLASLGTKTEPEKKEESAGKGFELSGKAA